MNCFFKKQQDLFVCKTKTPYFFKKLLIINNKSCLLIIVSLMNTKKLEFNRVLEKIRSNDTSLGTVLQWSGFLYKHGATYSLHYSKTDLPCALDCRASFAQFAEALKVNTRLIEIDLNRTSILFFCIVFIIFNHWFTIIDFMCAFFV